MTRVLANSKVSWGGSYEPRVGDGGCRRKVSLRCVRIAAKVIGDVGTKVRERKLVYERMPPPTGF